MVKRSKRFGVNVLFLLLIIVILMAINALAQDCLPGIVAYWKFDEDSGTIAYDSVGANHGTVYGAIWVDGKIGGALNFDGTDDYVSVEDSVSLKPAEEITVESWVMPDSISANYGNYIVSKYAVDWVGGYVQYITLQGRAAFSMKTTTGTNSVVSNIILSPGNWYYIVSTYDGAAIKIYINGKLEGQINHSGTFVHTANKLTIGIRNFNPSNWPCYFDGTIDEVAIYNRALSPEDIQQRYQRTIATLPVAIAGTSLDGNNMLQLDGTLSSDPQGEPLTFSWQIDGELALRTGQIVSISDLPVGNYQVTLTVSNGIYTDTDTMLFAVPVGAGVLPPPVDALQEQVQNLKDKISGFSIDSFDAPNEKAAENRRKALLNMLDKVSEHIEAGDFQAAIDQLQDILVKSDGLAPPDSPYDWVVDNPASPDINEQEETAQLISNLIYGLENFL
jgi:hypothetical protein